MRFRLAVLLLLALTVASGATAATRSGASATGTLGAPQDLHGFLLRADEASADTFSRTPSFAWKPVRGAVRYEFELSSARTFASGAIITRETGLTSPAASLRVALPWFSGTPYSLYAHVRGIAPSGAVGPWSAPFGFNMRWSGMPTPMSAPPGLLRWATVDGATEYNVWLLDANKIITSESNVADEREYYTFHQQAKYSGTVHWRIRAVRALYGLTSTGTQKNGVPVVTYGPWSPVYTSTNPTFATGTLKAVETISDATSTLASPAAHHLMPAFVFQGNTGLDGVSTELYRIYVATDRDCVNIVFRGAVVGGPAYAPRKNGTIGLPGDLPSLTADRSLFLADGAEGQTFTADGEHKDPNEELPADVSPLTSGEDDSPSTDPAGGGTGGTGTGTGTGGTGATGGTTGTGGATGGTTTGAPGVATLPADGIQFGPPIDLWDTDWPTGRYFWTVVPVGVITSDPFTTSLAQVALDGASTITVGGAQSLVVGNQLQIGSGANQEIVSVVSVSGATVAIAPSLRFAHGAGEKVARLGGTIQYQDLELPQDACAAGRVLTFGKTSEPALTQSNGLAPFASGLSPDGKLISAQGAKPVFYGAPVVNWQPALSASAYEVQWSKTRYPFKAAATPIMTYATSTVLPLTPGSWWYRVRGLNLALPSGARAMGWSDPIGIVVAKPKYTVVKPATKKTAKKR
jgi:hypothetical protein